MCDRGGSVRDATAADGLRFLVVSTIRRNVKALNDKILRLVGSNRRCVVVVRFAITVTVVETVNKRINVYEM